MQETQSQRAVPSLSPSVRRRAAASLPLPEPGRYLAIEDGDDMVLVALRSGVTRIGRSMLADVRLESPAVSRRHALILVDGGAAVLVDDRSRNGTWLNGERIQRAPIAHGDVLQIGDTQMRVVLIAGDRLLPS
jgi:pSer/pThr/pTyr-binding forkhead associated (FHA) protein